MDNRDRPTNHRFRRPAAFGRAWSGARPRLRDRPRGVRMRPTLFRLSWDVGPIGSGSSPSPPGGRWREAPDEGSWGALNPSSALPGTFCPKAMRATTPMLRDAWIRRRRVEDPAQDRGPRAAALRPCDVHRQRLLAWISRTEKGAGDDAPAPSRWEPSARQWNWVFNRPISRSARSLTPVPRGSRRSTSSAAATAASAAAARTSAVACVSAMAIFCSACRVRRVT